MRAVYASIIVILSLVASPVLAQFDAGSIAPQLEIELKPPYPKPGEEVVATLNDYSGGAYGASITWVFNGRTVTEATNQRQVTFVAGKSGVTESISVVLSKPNGTSETLRKEIVPTYLDIIVEPQTRVPDFYQGRALPSVGSVVNATVLIDGALGASNLMYTWRVDREVVNGGPLRGGSQVTFVAPRGSGGVLSLQVNRLDGTTVANRAVLLPTVSPEIHFYEVSTLFGQSHKTVADSFALIGNSATIKAEPYYLDTRVYNNPTISEWQVGGQDAGQVNGSPYEVTVQRVGLTGASNLRFHVRDTKQVLQGADASMQINF